MRERLIFIYGGRELGAARTECNGGYIITYNMYIEYIIHITRIYLLILIRTSWSQVPIYTLTAIALFVHVIARILIFSHNIIQYHTYVCVGRSRPGRRSAN